MATNLESLERVYKQLLDVSSQIGQLIERGLYDDLIGYIDKKDRLLQEASKLADITVKEEVDTSELQELCRKIQESEKSNLIAVDKVRDKIKQQLKDNAGDKKFVNAYSGTSHTPGNILDFSE